MKLSKQQIEALSLKICETINKSNLEYNKNLIESKEYIDFIKNYMSSDEGIEYYNNLKFAYDYGKAVGLTIITSLSSFESIATSIRSKKYPFKEQRINKYSGIYNNISNAIIVKTIDCENLDDLITQITDQFST